MIISSPAIVLRVINYQETSLIATLLTWEHGKIAVMVRGAKRPKSSFSGLMEPGNILDTIYYYKQTRSVQTLKEASFRHKTFDIRTDVEKWAVGLSTAEMVMQLSHEHEINHPMYEFAEKLFAWLNDTEQSVRAIFPYIQLRLAELMGTGLQMSTQLAESDWKDETLWLNIQSGMVDSQALEDRRYRLSKKQAQYLKQAFSNHTAKILQLDISKSELQELIRYLDAYLKYHIEGLRDRKSDVIFEQIL
ncbi:MAG TPA: DNA repair protein RecO [Balneolales bacterium]|nr:DNA repair protein RecO [Balneolales bacterium]